MVRSGLDARRIEQMSLGAGDSSGPLRRCDRPERAAASAAGPAPIPMMEPPQPAASHVPVLLEQVVDAVAQGPHGVILDGTVGLGGHASAVLTRIAGVERYVGIDRDPEALERAREVLAGHGSRVVLAHATFDRAGGVLDANGIDRVDVALLDLGVSSLQLDRADRGFSFREDGPLDMRMDRTSGPTARELIERLSHGELARLLKESGEVECAGRVARVLHEGRQHLRRTGDVARLVGDVLPGSLKARMKIHPATKVFLALRIAVNDELALLSRALPGLLERLCPGGRLIVIAFHSLEDRIVKRFLADEARGCICPPQLPVCACGRLPRVRVGSRRPVAPGPDEVASNPRSRSAKMRIGVRL